jgi:HEAT repeat protein
MAITLLIEYHLAKDERAMVQITERLGQTKSPLTVDELLEALKDPRFNVRFEAIISIARTRSDPRLTEALIKILTGTELALSVVAAWALGRIGDQTALEALRQGLDSDYQSIRAHCARALGTLGDRAIAPLLLERLQHAPDKGLQMAYASTLGKLKFDEATGALLDLLHITENEGARMELALSLARIIGAESHFIRLLRDARQDTGTGTSQAVSALKKKIPKELENGDDLTASIHDCANALARNNLDEGALLLEQLLVQLPSARFGESCVLILEECAKRLGEFKATRLEYLLLALHTANVGWQT